MPFALSSFSHIHCYSRQQLAQLELQQVHTHIFTSLSGMKSTSFVGALLTEAAAAAENVVAASSSEQPEEREREREGGGGAVF